MVLEHAEPYRVWSRIGDPMPSWGAMLLELNNTALLARSHCVYLPIALLVVVLMIFEFFMPEVETNV